MEVAVTIDRSSMFALWDLRNRLHEASRQLQTTGQTAVVRMLAFVTSEYGEAWEESAPFLTGSLASATREQVIFDTGRVFIDPSTVNPILGGRPSEYGPTVHMRRPWVEQVFYTETQRIVEEGQQLIWEAMDEVFIK
jgi:hypothetical protein